MPSVLGEKIRSLRQSKGMTLDQLGQAAGSSKSYLSGNWKPRSAAAFREKLQKIADALGVTVEYLLDERTEGTPSEEVFTRHFTADTEAQRRDQGAGPGDRRGLE